MDEGQPCMCVNIRVITTQYTHTLMQKLVSRIYTLYIRTRLVYVSYTDLLGAYTYTHQHHHHHHSIYLVIRRIYIYRERLCCLCLWTRFFYPHTHPTPHMAHRDCASSFATQIFENQKRTIYLLNRTSVIQDYRIGKTCALEGNDDDDIYVPRASPQSSDIYKYMCSIYAIVYICRATAHNTTTTHRFYISILHQHYYHTFSPRRRVARLGRGL